MTGLLTLLILLGIAIAIWQMVKIFDLTQGKRDTTQIANDKDNSVNGYLMLGFLGFIYLITIISFAMWGDLPLVSNSASEHGPWGHKQQSYHWPKNQSLAWHSIL